MTENHAISVHLGYRVTDRRFADGYLHRYFAKTLPPS